MNIKFGANAPITVDRKRKTSIPTRKSKPRADVDADGVETDGFTRYDHNVGFANIRANVNVTRVKDDDATDYGVVKGAILGGVPITVPKNDSAATLNAMKKRCDYAPRAPDMDVFKRGHADVMSRMEPMPTIRVDREHIMDYVSGYSSSKAERLLAALEESQLNWDGDAKHVFAKQEVLLKPHGAQPRVVYQGTDMYNLLAGCVQVELARRMKQVFSLSNPKNVGNRLIFAAGLTNEEIGDILETSPGVMVENDMKNNDGSQSVEFRKYEAMLYAKLGAPMWFVREFARNLEVRVWTRYGVSAHVRGQMWSGVQNTTTGNTYVGMCCMLAALQDAGIQSSTNVHGGDDYLGVVPEESVDRFVTAIQDAVPAVGMSPEPVVPASREHATFYRKRYVRGVNGTRGVPQFGRVLSKLNIRSNMNQNVCDRDYMAGKYLSAAYEHRYAPGLSSILLEASSAMSEKPYVDHNTNREVGHKGAEFIRAKIEVAPLDVDSFNGFLNDVYGINHTDLCDLYGRVAESAVMWLDKWTMVGKNGRSKSKRGVPVDKLTGDVVESLVRMDVAG